MGTLTEETPFWERPLGTLDDAEWEALCDGCGQCCLIKLEDADTGAIYDTDVACTLLDVCTARCSDYSNRKAKVPDCQQMTRENAGTLPWLPATCAYRLRAEGKPLPEWHYLVCGDREAVVRAGISVAGRVISEDEVDAIEDHVCIEGFDAIRVDDGDGDGA
ncbi:YcgN family cysteine cluster protein [Croceicoccus bisphenolivorans]|uniref:YcgN family cysteine cluster protein n=1 Tax=Croceicoccus bisphenolivorans TaxID=1783232 RepID=UPI00083132F8|nr:YcgN family cysteine cluster protein [Croceicoccus bisphenolivorans]